MTGEGEVVTFEGVGVLWRGDTVLVVYQAAARLHRTRWLFDWVDTVVSKTPDGLLALMVVLPSADIPDAPTRTENNVRLRKLGTHLRRLVTVPVGDAFRMSVVRTVMRAINILQGKSNVQFVSNTIDHGIREVLAGATAKTPSGSEIFADLLSVHKALGAEMPRARAGASSGDSAAARHPRA